MGLEPLNVIIAEVVELLGRIRNHSVVEVDWSLLEDLEELIAAETEVICKEPMKSRFEHVVQTIAFLHFLLFN
jgi:hypothetical protein